MNEGDLGSHLAERYGVRVMAVEALDAGIRARPLMLECWAFGAGRRRLADAVERVSEVAKLADAIAPRARKAFER